METITIIAFPAFALSALVCFCAFAPSACGDLPRRLRRHQGQHVSG